MPLIESKLPKDWRLKWAREKAGLAKDDVTFSKLVELLEHGLDVRKSADQSEKKSQSPRHQPSAKGGIPLSTASGLMAKPVICTFCKRPHSPNDCCVPMSVEARFHKVRVVKACFRSGRSGHRMAVCRHRKPCARGYYTLQLCKTGEVRVPDVTSPAPTRTQAIQAGILVSLPRTNH